MTSLILELSPMIRFNGRNAIIFFIMNNFSKSLKSMICIIFGCNENSLGKSSIVINNYKTRVITTYGHSYRGSKHIHVKQFKKQYFFFCLQVFLVCFPFGHA